MPKTRIHRKGAKSIARRIKHKIGGRKSVKGTNTMPNTELNDSLRTCRKKDINKLRRAIEARTMGVDLPS